MTLLVGRSYQIPCINHSNRGGRGVIARMEERAYLVCYFLSSVVAATICLRCSMDDQVVVKKKVQPQRREKIESESIAGDYPQSPCAVVDRLPV